jgi:hypothetical protein
LLGDAESRNLGEDIAKHGLRNPIVLYQGKILDGRNRYRECQNAQIEITDSMIETYEGDDPLGLVISLNVMRRHLTLGQRAMAADRITTLGRGRRTDLEPRLKLTEVSQEQAAQKLGVSVASVKSAHAVREAARLKQTPGLVVLVDSGIASVSLAEELSKQDARTIRQIVARVNAGAEMIDEIRALRDEGKARTSSPTKPRTTVISTQGAEPKEEQSLVLKGGMLASVAAAKREHEQEKQKALEAEGAPELVEGTGEQPKQRRDDSAVGVADAADSRQTVEEEALRDLRALAEKYQAHRLIRTALEAALETIERLCPATQRHECIAGRQTGRPCAKHGAPLPAARARRTAPTTPSIKPRKTTPCWSGSTRSSRCSPRRLGNYDQGRV